VPVVEWLDSVMSRAVVSVESGAVYIFGLRFARGVIAPLDKGLSY
jgi:hypothetical protein